MPSWEKYTRVYPLLQLCYICTYVNKEVGENYNLDVSMGMGSIFIPPIPLSVTLITPGSPKFSEGSSFLLAPVVFVLI